MRLYEIFETGKKQDLIPKTQKIDQTPADLMVKKDFAFFQFHILLEYFPNFRR